MQKPSGFSTRAVLAVGLISLQYMIPQPSHAACVLTPGTGNDTYTCDSGSSPGLTDLSGDNSLTLSTGGTINGNNYSYAGDAPTSTVSVGGVAQSAPSPT